MSDYKPTTQVVRLNYIIANAGPYSGGGANAAAAFDRWMADMLVAHDAEKRAEWEAEQGETDWEYGTALRTPSGETWDHFSDRSRAEAEDALRLSLESPEDYWPNECILVRRVPGRDPGPWLPVPDCDTPESED